MNSRTSNSYNLVDALCCHLVLLAALASTSLLHADESLFERRVLPLLREHCLDCHGAETKESHLRLDTMVWAIRGGDSGEPIIVPGSSLKSHLIERVTSSDPKMRMPPDGVNSLTEEQVTLLRAWIDDPTVWEAARDEAAKQRIDHWSFQPVKRPPLPKSSRENPIDSFIEAKLAEAGLSHSKQAEKRKLIRRLYLVMHGLTPTREEVDQFLQDTRPQAWSEWVDRVLDSPRYGERIAMNWLDLIHFGETNGFETNRERLMAYPFRDWVIDAFNSDKPYDEFIQQQIAGDTLGEPIATGFLVAGPNDIVKGQDPLLGLMQRQDELTDIVNTTGTAFLGLTTGCARCHNHKFDPITQTDFFAMQAVFAGVEHGEQQLPLDAKTQSILQQMDDEAASIRGSLSKYANSSGIRESVNSKQNAERFTPIRAKFVRFTIHATNASEPCIDELQVFSGDQNVALGSSGAVATSSGDFEHPLHKLSHLNDGQFGNSKSWIAKVIQGGWAQIEFPETKLIDRIVWQRDRDGAFADRLAIDYQITASVDAENWTVIASSKDRLPFSKDIKPQYNFENLPEEEAAAAKQLLAKMKTIDKQKSEMIAGTKVYAGTFKQPGTIVRLFRGDPMSPREEVQPGVIESLGQVALQSHATDKQRRTAMATWIANNQNPLTARVMANRIWQFHFGTGIVDTPSDFGANGTLPTHPELLDFLASEFMEKGWSIKQLHRMILMSDTWRQDSFPREDGMKRDAGTRLLWRFPPRRLEAEGIRDCILAVSGRLDLRMGGPGFSAFEVELENVRHYFPKKDYGPADWRRMVYMTKVRMEKDSVFGAFDCPDNSQVTPKRNRSTTPLQAFNLLNSRFVLQQAELFVQRLDRDANTLDQRIQLAFQLCFGRSATPDEMEQAIAFQKQYGMMALARALLNANEFVFIP
jgi:Protein of unknown function (DUF1553)/Protein of unknown function (DUF1549)/Planctomycete cytochrome C